MSALADRLDALDDALALARDRLDAGVLDRAARLAGKAGQRLRLGEQQTVVALAGVDLRIDAGELVAVVGSSGSGKTTLMNVIGCLDTPTSGTYRLRGRLVAGLGDDEKAVQRNQALFAQVIGATPVYLKQSHGANVVRLVPADAKSDAPVHEADAAVTTEKDMARLVGETGAAARLRERAEAFPLVVGVRSVLVVARKGSPLIIGVGDDEYVVASDASAIVEHTQQVIYLNDNEMAVLRPDSFKTTTIDDVEVVELNEAFAAQVLPVCRELGIDPFSDKLNPHGGAIALGHPYGMTGARIMATLLNDLESGDRTIGLETMCVGGGQGMAMIVERV